MVWYTILQLARIPLGPVYSVWCKHASNPYTTQLLALDRCSNLIQGNPCLRPTLNKIITPVDINFWPAELKLHKDKAFTQYILSGLTKGFRLGFRQPPHGLLAAKRNLLSASEYPQEVTEHITKELALNRLALAGTGDQRKPHQPLRDNP